MGRLATINALYAEIIFPVIVNEFCCLDLFTFSYIKSYMLRW